MRHDLPTRRDPDCSDTSAVASDRRAPVRSSPSRHDGSDIESVTEPRLPPGLLGRMGELDADRVGERGLDLA
jgi:hypothetical protein